MTLGCSVGDHYLEAEKHSAQTCKSIAFASISCIRKSGDGFHGRRGCGANQMNEYNGNVALHAR